jgi:hypothetical protein
LHRKKQVKTGKEEQISSTRRKASEAKGEQFTRTGSESSKVNFELSLWFGPHYREHVICPLFETMVWTWTESLPLAKAKTRSKGMQTPANKAKREAGRALQGLQPEVKVVSVLEENQVKR